MLIANRYELIKNLSPDGMGEVFLAFDSEEKKECVVKLLPVREDTSDERKKRFIREIIILSFIKHPSIVKYIASGETESYIYYVMEFVDGEPIHQINLTTPKIVSLLKQIASALSVLHEKEIVHRDLKPENILVSGGRAVLIDLGVAHLKTEQARLTSVGSLIGTTFFMSPEQIQGKKIDGRSDIYSLGIVLYELLTGDPPFYEDDFVGLINKIVSEKPIPPSELGFDVSPELESICLKCLQKNANNRYQSANGLFDALSALEDGFKIPHDKLIPVSKKRLPLIGREKIVHDISLLLDKTLTGESASILIYGPSNMGKSRLLEEIQTTAISKGFINLVYQRNNSSSSNSSITTLLDRIANLDIIIDPLGLSSYGSAIRAFSPEMCKFLNVVPDPSLASTIPIGAVSELIIEATKNINAVFLFEEGIDEIGRAVMFDLVKMMPTGKAIISVSSEDDDRFDNRYAVNPLSRAQLEMMVQEVFGREITEPELDAFERKTEGNPVFAFELLLKSNESGIPISDSSLPDDLNELIFSDIKSLDKKALNLLICLSVVEEPLQRLDAYKISAFSDEETSSLLADLIVKGLVTEKETDDATFYHVSDVVKAATIEACDNSVREGVLSQLVKKLEITNSFKYMFEIGKIYSVLGNDGKAIEFLLTKPTLYEVEYSDFWSCKISELLKNKLDTINDINDKIVLLAQMYRNAKTKGEILESKRLARLLLELESHPQINGRSKRAIIFQKIIGLPDMNNDSRWMEYTDELLKLDNDETSLKHKFLIYHYRTQALSLSGRSKEALDWGFKSLDVALSTNNPSNVCNAYNGIIIAYIELKDFDEATKYLEKMEEVSSKNYLPLYNLIATINLGMIYHEKGELDDAKEILERSIDFAKKQHLNRTLYHVYMNLISLNLRLCEFDDAKKNMLDLWELFLGSGEKSLAIVEKAKVLECCLSILEGNKVDFERVKSDMFSLGAEISDESLSANLHVCDAEYLISRVDFESVPDTRKRFLEIHGDDESADLSTHNILLILLEAYIFSYEGNIRKANILLKQATGRLKKDISLNDDFWLSKTYELSALALEIAKTKKQYSRMFSLTTTPQHDDVVFDLFKKLLDIVNDKSRWMYIGFYFWPRVSMMLGEFVTWLMEQDDLHPRLDMMVEETIAPLENVIDYLKDNGFTAYLNKLQTQKRILSWHTSNMSK